MICSVISCLPVVLLPRFHLREIFKAQEQYKTKSFLSQADVDILLFWHNFSIKSPENLQELWPDPASTALYTDASGKTGTQTQVQVLLHRRHPRPATDKRGHCRDELEANESKIPVTSRGNCVGTGVVAKPKRCVLAE